MSEQNVAIVRAIFESGWTTSKGEILGLYRMWTAATVFAVFTVRDGKVSRYREFDDEAAAHAALS